MSLTSHSFTFPFKREKKKLNDKDEPMLADFGFARQSETSQIITTRAVGTWQWLAPEMMDAGGVYSNKVDVYAFGIIIWELLSGEVQAKPSQLRSFYIDGNPISVSAAPTRFPIIRKDS